MTSTVGALNVGNIHKMCEYYGDRFIAGSFITNNSYNISSIPPDIKDLYLNRLLTELFMLVTFACLWLKGRNTYLHMRAV